jgi:hypothetical protein
LRRRQLDVVVATTTISVVAMTIAAVATTAIVAVVVMTIAVVAILPHTLEAVCGMLAEIAGGIATKSKDDARGVGLVSAAGRAGMVVLVMARSVAMAIMPVLTDLRH